MRIGVISDTHDNLVNVRKAVEAFEKYGVETLLHCGDFCSPFTLAEFKSLRDRGIGMRAVFGNNDGDRALLVRRGEGFCEFRDGAWSFDLEGLRVLLLHYPDTAEALWRCGEFDLVVHGHDHRARVEGGERKLLDPGTCSGYLASRATVAVVESVGLAVEIVEIA